jgi:Fur family ferric uptake transcriptional regulator
VQKARDVFEKFLSHKALRLTPQRSLILETFLKNEGHLTTEEFYGLVKKRDSRVGYTTVYRTLKLLSESGIAREVDFGDGFLRYEHEFGHDHHDHLICERCKRSVEVLDPDIEVLQEKLARKHGFEVSKHRMDIFGVCSDCKSKE